MRLTQVMSLTEAKPLTDGPDLDREVRTGFASDLMSDVLRFDVAHGLLVTGLANPQVVRTAEMADVTAILLVRGKTPPPETRELAQEVGIPIIGHRSHHVRDLRPAVLRRAAGLRPPQRSLMTEESRRRGPSGSSHEVAKAQELVYELKIGEVMTRKLITIPPTATMHEVKNLHAGQPDLRYPGDGGR